MPKQRFEHRFLFESDFYEENKTIPRLLLKLMYISANSREYKKCHNIMSKKDFDRVITRNPSLGREYLKASFKPVEEPEMIEEIEDDFLRNIKYAIYLGNMSPFRTIVFCSKSNHEGYKEHPHLKGLKNVAIRSGNEALKLIEEFFFQVTAK